MLSTTVATPVRVANEPGRRRRPPAAGGPARRGVQPSRLAAGSPAARDTEPEPGHRRRARRHHRGRAPDQRADRRPGPRQRDLVDHPPRPRNTRRPRRLPLVRLDPADITLWPASAPAQAAELTLSA